MVHLSSEKLQNSHKNKLRTQLAQLLARTNTKSATQLLETLLGDEEQLMIAKRLAAIILFEKGCSAYRVARTLHISPTTANVMQTRYEMGEFNAVIRVVGRSRADREKFWNTLEVILRAGLPPRGKGRWKTVYKLMES